MLSKTGEMSTDPGSVNSLDDGYEVIYRIDVPDEMAIIPAELGQEILQIQKDNDIDIEQEKTSIPVYSYLLISTGLWIPNRWSKAKKIFFRIYRFIIFLVIQAFICFEFGLFCLCTDQSWLLLEKQYPFTFAHYIFGEVRWFATYIIVMVYCSNGSLDKFVNDLEIPKKEFKNYRVQRNFYFSFIFSLLVVFPCLMLYFDLLWLETHNLGNITMFILLWKFLYRVLVFPSFSFVTVILFLVGKQILLTGEKICSYSTTTRRKVKRRKVTLRSVINSLKHRLRYRVSTKKYKERKPQVLNNEVKGVYEVEQILKKLKHFIRNTQSSLNLYLTVHMVLLAGSAFTTTMSTIERLELSNNQNNTPTVVTFNIKNHPIPVTDLMESKSSLLKLNAILNSIQLNNSTPNDTHEFYHTMANLQENMIRLMENVLASDQQQKNASIKTVLDKYPTFYKLVMTITDKYGSMRVILDALLCLFEIMVLFMVPVFLINRTDCYLLVNRHKVLDADIREQQRNRRVFDDRQKKRDVIEYMDSLDGVRIYGHQVNFFSTLTLASFGPIFAIAMRGVWKHYGLF